MFPRPTAVTGTKLEGSSDRQLVDQVERDRSEAACHLLYSRHHPIIMRVAWRLLGQSEDDADDVVQESWISAFESLDRWNKSGSFGAWLCRIVVHKSIDRLRRDQRLLSIDDNEVAIKATERDLDLESAIALLPAGYRTVLVLHDVEGFSHDEIAEQLGITPGTSRGQLFKARRAIRRVLGENETGGNHE